MSRPFLSVLLLTSTLIAFGQKPKKVTTYTPVTGVNMEEVFPVAAYMVKHYYKGDMDYLAWGDRHMRSYYIGYYWGLGTQCRAKVNYRVDDGQGLDLTMDPVEIYDPETHVWSGAREDKRELNIKIEIAEYIRKYMASPDSVRKAKDWFYSNLRMNACFFETATELAGQRWFESYLKDKPVKWNLPFDDVKQNTAEGYKYAEYYSGDITNTALDPNADAVKRFQIVKYTNSDKNVMSSKGSAQMVTGYIRSLEFESNSFLITVTETLQDPLPKTSAHATQQQGGGVLENADKLKKLKELYDAQILSKEEYEAEKKKILDGGK
ncbi:MAG: SHOCT domain-containing protein [Flavobacteriales bacterium]|nr:SHOCT domain-containing protein [Flavobacteriales bacterium]MBP6697557.1 SHOCT domain-containing protein [Flavobacteriales bacterium]